MASMLGVLVQDDCRLLAGGRVVRGKGALPLAGDDLGIKGPLDRVFIPAAVLDAPIGRSGCIVVLPEVLRPAAALGKHRHRHGPAHGGTRGKLPSSRPGEQARFAHIVHSRGVPGIWEHVCEPFHSQAAPASRAAARAVLMSFCKRFPIVDPPLFQERP